MRKLSKNEFSQPLPDRRCRRRGRSEHPDRGWQGSEDEYEGCSDRRRSIMAGAALEDDRLLLHPLSPVRGLSGWGPKAFRGAGGIADGLGSALSGMVATGPWHGPASPFDGSVQKGICTGGGSRLAGAAWSKGAAKRQ